MRADHLVALARVLKVSESWLATGEQQSADVETDMLDGVRYGGVVEAGAFRPDPDGGLNQDDALRTVPIPADRRYPLSAQYAFRVVGDSMTEAHIFEGMWVLAVDVHVWERMHGEPGDGKLVVVARTRSGNPERELTVKRLRIFRDRLELQPQSTNTTHKPIVFPLPAREDEPAEAAIIAVVVASTWLYG